MLIPALCSSFCEVIITQPLDVIKIQYQNNTRVVYKFKNLYTGLIPRSVGNIPVRSTFLMSQEFLEKQNMFYKKILIPIGAGFMQTIIDTPFEVMKINKINRINNRNLYSGFMPHLFRNIIFLLPVYNFKKINMKITGKPKTTTDKSYNNTIFCYDGYTRDC